MNRLVTIEKEYVLEKLYALIGLCQKTDSETLNEKIPLFSGHIVAAQQMFDRTEKEYGFNDHFDLSEVMRQANKLWKIRTKVKDGNWDGISELELVEDIEDFLAKGQKINAIKHYRTVMKETVGTQPSLRESKNYVDAIHEDLKHRGVI
jgi:ribosomal protein L7/L12